MDAYRWGYACPQAAYAGNQRRVRLQMLQTDSMTGTSTNPDDGGRSPTGPRLALLQISPWPTSMLSCG